MLSIKEGKEMYKKVQGQSRHSKRPTEEFMKIRNYLHPFYGIHKPAGAGGGTGHKKACRPDAGYRLLAVGEGFEPPRGS